jgi:hypothetical protein
MKWIFKTKADIVGGVFLAVLLVSIVVGTLMGSALAAVMLTGLAGFLPAYVGVLLATSHPTWGKRIAVLCLVLLVASVFVQITLILNSSDAFSWFGYNTAVGMVAQGALMGFAMATLYGLFRPEGS